MGSKSIYYQEFGLLLLRLQQAGLTVIKTEWNNWQPEEETSDADPAELEDFVTSTKDKL